MDEQRYLQNRGKYRHLRGMHTGVCRKFDRSRRYRLQSKIVSGVGPTESHWGRTTVVCLCWRTRISFIANRQTKQPSSTNRTNQYLQGWQKLHPNTRGRIIHFHARWRHHDWRNNYLSLETESETWCLHASFRRWQSSVHHMCAPLQEITSTWSIPDVW